MTTEPDAPKPQGSDSDDTPPVQNPAGANDPAELGAPPFALPDIPKLLEQLMDTAPVTDWSEQEIDDLKQTAKRAIELQGKALLGEDVSEDWKHIIVQAKSLGAKARWSGARALNLVASSATGQVLQVLYAAVIRG